MSRVLQMTGKIVAIGALGGAALLFPTIHILFWLVLVDSGNHTNALLWCLIIRLIGAYSAISSIVRLIKSSERAVLHQYPWLQQILFVVCFLNLLYETVVLCYYQGLADWLFDGGRLLLIAIFSASLVYNIIDNHRAFCRRNKHYKHEDVRTA